MMDFDVDKFKKWKRDGKTYREMSKLSGIPAYTIARKFKSMGFDKTRTFEQKPPKEIPKPTKQIGEETLVEILSLNSEDYCKRVGKILEVHDRYYTVEIEFPNGNKYITSQSILPWKIYN